MHQFFFFITLLSAWLKPGPLNQEGEEAVVQAVLFYSPSCGHCQIVIQEVLPPLLEKYGDQLQIIGINVSQPGAMALYSAAIEHYNLESSGVPALFVGDQYMIGSVDIPEKFPPLIEQHLAQGGVSWPAIPGLEEALTASQTAQASSPTSVTSQAAPAANPTASISIATPEPTATVTALLVSSHTGTSLEERFRLDLWGNTLAVIVLAGMIAASIGLLFYLSRSSTEDQVQSPDWLIPLLCVVGLGVAGYLAYVETTQVSAVCGPIGDCNTVQQSSYARLFGVLPIGVLGLFGYVSMGIAWVIGRFGKGQAAAWASLALFLLSVFGVMFSIYLTFLEPFVIGATCAWCLTSAILMTALMWLSARRGIQAWSQLQGKTPAQGTA